MNDGAMKLRMHEPTDPERSTIMPRSDVINATLVASAMKSTVGSARGVESSNKPSDGSAPRGASAALLVMPVGPLKLVRENTLRLVGAGASSACRVYLPRFSSGPV